MDNEVAERIAMALEGIEQAISRQAEAQELALSEQRAFIERQQAAQQEMARRMGIAVPAAGGILRGQ